MTEKSNNRSVLLVASGDLRESANKNCWAAQQAMEQQLQAAAAKHGFNVQRAHRVKESGHGFIATQREGIDIFREIDPEAPLIVAEAVWQYSHHVLPGLTTHRGPILTVANWSGQWPGLVGMLNLNASLTKANVDYSTLWSESFDDEYFTKRFAEWLETGTCVHDESHARSLSNIRLDGKCEQLGETLAKTLFREKAILGVFDEGCMGMFNAIVPDHLLNKTGVFKERLSQSALYYETTQVDDQTAQAVRQWMEDHGMAFHTGPNHAEHLTDDQIHQQCKMYVAALRLADDFGCDVIGIQYQQGLKDLLPASDLVEGALNNAERPPVTSRDGSRILYEGEPLPHFNEVDECAGLDALITYRVQTAMNQPVESTLHDIRWGDVDPTGTVDDYVWVLLISGAAPPAHFGGWQNADGHRQPAMYFPNGGSTLRGISKPGEIVWSRIYIEQDSLKMDIGRGAAVELLEEETNRRWQETTFQWPIMHGVTYGISRDRMMAKHKSNHIQVVYATDNDSADRVLQCKAAMARGLGIQVNVCGSRSRTIDWE